MQDQDQEALTKIAEELPGAAEAIYKIAAANGQALELLKNPNDACAVTLLMSLRALYSEKALFWEPETIWMSLENDYGIDLSVEDRGKIMAAITLVRYPSFFWDNLVFQRTVKALCGIHIDPESLPECHPSEMAWAMYEAELLRGLDPEKMEFQPQMDSDVKQYIAVCLLRAGMVYPPRGLELVSENLTAMLPEENRGKAQEVKDSWTHLDKKNLPHRRYGEDFLDVQLAQLASCHLSVSEKAQRMAEEIGRLVSTSS